MLVTEFTLSKFRFKKKSKSPAHLQNLCTRKSQAYLEKRLTTYQTAPSSRVATPNACASRPGTGQHKLLFTSSKTPSTRTKKPNSRERAELSLTMSYENAEMSVELVAIDQFRKAVIREIQSSTNTCLTPERLREIRSSSVQREMLNVDGVKHYRQGQKRKKELLSKNYLSNAAYMIRALPNASRATLLKELRTAIPGATRFHHIR